MNDMGMETCQQCGEPFEPANSDATRFATFCSSECEARTEQERAAEFMDRLEYEDMLAASEDAQVEP